MLGPLTYGALSQVTTAANWWEAGGAPTPVAVYQPKGAASLAASYVNLVNPGTFDAAPGVAPTWDTTNGWIFNGTTQYLTTGIVPVNDQTWAAVVRFSNLSGTAPITLGANESTGDPRFYLGRNSTNQMYANGGQLNTAVSGTAAGVQAFASSSGYMDGSLITSTIPSAAGTATRGLYIGARNTGGTPFNFAPCYIQAIAIYSSSTNHATWVPAVSQAVSLL